MSIVLCIMHVGRCVKEQQKGENRGKLTATEQIQSFCESISQDRI